MEAAILAVSAFTEEPLELLAASEQPQLNVSTATVEKLEQPAEAQRPEEKWLEKSPLSRKVMKCW
ncbi:unnamed protein product [Ceratitis capitata]|uniref:(Mediterranean fruit fly) hypothetical protein n=1 Tax=Ceratitis capitata TaxID=7213 RepID=A0A811VDY7_CERCA|nr:unnamed protein product [Ceratitis capitata]